jgi:hypothetical protein
LAPLVDTPAALLAAGTIMRSATARLGAYLLVGGLGFAAASALNPVGSPPMIDARSLLSTAPPLSSPTLSDTGAAEFVAPTVALSPREVVELQLGSLDRFLADPAALAQCFELASPANRALTGPLSHFALMVQTPPYYPLLNRVDALIGDPVIQGRRATVFVTVIDSQHRIRTFWFYLSRQTAAPYEDCWMTDGVLTADHSIDPPTDDVNPTT